jgi:CRP-like cAMP-binding protein
VPTVETARRNAILDGLSDEELQEFLPYAKDVSLTRGQILHEPGLPVNALYFPTSGIVSLVQDLSDTEVAEVATVGREGMTGLSVFLGATDPPERAVVQITGHALRISAPDFVAVSAEPNGDLQVMLRRYAQAMFTQLARNAACNRVHLVRQRAARWLLTCADRMQTSAFELTQESLAQLLAVRRASVGQVAQALADDGCLTYTRGSITILDADKLRANACDCYDAIRQATDQVMSEGR